MKEFEILRRRFGDRRPGLQLIAVELAAIPVTLLRVDVLAQERLELPLTEEFLLRLLAAGVNQPDEIAALLGLEPAHVLEAAAAQMHENRVSRAEGGTRLGLTPHGSDVASDLASLQPTLRNIPVAFDRLRWSVAGYPGAALITKKHAIEQGRTLLPAARNARIGLDDVSATEVNSLLQGDRVQVLKVRKVVVSKHLYLPAQLLVYADPSRGELEVGLCVDDDLSTDHELALVRVGAVQQLGLTIGESEPRPKLDDELESQLALSTARGEESSAGEEAVESRTAAGAPPAAVRRVSVYEHADLLMEALETAKHRILLISPWVKNAVVTTDFLAKLERRLRAGARVTVAHGIGDDDSGSDQSALRRLANLAARYEKFDLARLRNTHAKVLIFDDVWISTSFNWLSFRGDPDRTYRMEEGVLVSIQDRVDDEYKYYLGEIEQQRR